MAALSVQQISIAGLTPTMVAAAGGGDTVPAGDRNFLLVRNGGGSGITVTVTTPGTVGGLAIADATVSVGAGADKLIGPLTASLFGDPAAVAYSGVTSVTVACSSSRRWRLMCPMSR